MSLNFVFESRNFSQNNKQTKKAIFNDMFEKRSCIFNYFHLIFVHRLQNYPQLKLKEAEHESSESLESVNNHIFNQ